MTIITAFLNNTTTDYKVNKMYKLEYQINIILQMLLNILVTIRNLFYI
jgi:hypothetical protein